eukprot:TRINITY_DN15419_c0_g1_i1.p1 TRINITY_DN15419_c0_g1~~TRINITY_DN15419_c0_g1_i1.p1  ORF type:complete len:500 (+),score=123.10 TRINITY_DN15419_c0_g1_i1:80-1501(+)
MAGTSSTMGTRTPNGGAIEAAQTSYESCLVAVGSYNRFDNLAHKPHGTPAKRGIRIFHMNSHTGRLTLLHIVEDPELLNPAFLRYHPRRNVLYAVTEDITQENRLIAYSVSNTSGRLRKLGSIGAGGKSTCYIFPSHDNRFLLLVNYWDSSLCAVRVDEHGVPIEKVQVLPCGVHQTAPKQHGDDPHGGHRTKETHAHALVLDPLYSRVAYVPDLGEGVIKQFVFDSESGQLHPAGQFPAGLGDGPHGPRYIEFHPWLNCAYVVNELGSSIAVFELDEHRMATLQPGEDQAPTLHCVSTVSTIPAAFPKKMNTCGRIAVHGNGHFVLVSNRGHDSVAVYRVQTDTNAGAAGSLQIVSFFHTGGRTPRHFKFDHTGKWLLAANQDSDRIAIFAFDTNTGNLTYTGSYYVPSPSFVQIRMAQHEISAARRVNTQSIQKVEMPRTRSGLAAAAAAARIPRDSSRQAPGAAVSASKL